MIMYVCMYTYMYVCMYKADTHEYIFMHGWMGTDMHESVFMNECMIACIYMLQGCGLSDNKVFCSCSGHLSSIDRGK